MIDELVARTPTAISAVRRLLPQDFPSSVAESILTGVQEAAKALEQGMSPAVDAGVVAG